MTPEHLRDLFRYTEWADAEVWRAVLAHDAARTDAKLRGLLAFTCTWCSAAFSWSGRTSPGEPAMQKASSLDNVMDFHAWVQPYYADVHRFLETLDAAMMARGCDHAVGGSRIRRGSGERSPRRRLPRRSLQVTSHSTYHRGQVNARLREVGVSRRSSTTSPGIWVRKTRAPVVPGDGRRAATQPPPGHQLRSQFGDIDIYLFDQLLAAGSTPLTRPRRRLWRRPQPRSTSCSTAPAYGMDAEAERFGASARSRLDWRRLPAENFVAGARPPAVRMEAWQQSSAVPFCTLRRTKPHWGGWCEEMWRVLGARTGCSSPGSRRPSASKPSSAKPDVWRACRTNRPAFLVDEATLLQWTDRLGGRLADPIKTTNVQQKRCMTTWCVIKT